MNSFESMLTVAGLLTQSGSSSQFSIRWYGEALRCVYFEKHLRRKNPRAPNRESYLLGTATKKGTGYLYRIFTDNGEVHSTHYDGAILALAPVEFYLAARGQPTGLLVIVKDKNGRLLAQSDEACPQIQYRHSAALNVFARPSDRVKLIVDLEKQAIILRIIRKRRIGAHELDITDVFPLLEINWPRTAAAQDGFMFLE